MKEEREVMYDSPEAARMVTIHIDGKQVGERWLSIDNIICHDEAAARYMSHTHKLCDCGVKMERGYTKCESCRQAAAYHRHMALPFKEYNGDPVVTWDGDDYFFSDTDIIDFMEEHELESLDLLFCEENRYNEVDGDYWSDIMPSEGDGELPKELTEQLEKLNEVIKTLPPASYSPGKIRTSYKI